MPGLAEVLAARSALSEVPVSLLLLQVLAFVKETFCVFNLELYQLMWRWGRGSNNLPEIF